MKTKVCAFAPATVANLSCGFDVLGLALNNIGDKVEVSFSKSKEVKILEIQGFNNIPLEADKNSCGVVIKSMLKALNVTKGIDVRIMKGYESGSGLGSSSASSAAAAFALNELLEKPFKRKDLIQFAAEGERIACGAAHIDNVSPAILGGITLVRSHNPVDVINLPVPDNLHLVVLFPRITIKTRESRKILRKNIPLDSVTKQMGNIAAFVASLFNDDENMLRRSMQDHLVEETRSLLIPKYDLMKKSVLENKALGFGISGSGPSVFALTNSYSIAQKIKKDLSDIYNDISIKYECFIQDVNKDGAKIVDSF